MKKITACRLNNKKQLCNIHQICIKIGIQGQYFHSVCGAQFNTFVLPSTSHFTFLLKDTVMACFWSAWGLKCINCIRCVHLILCSLSRGEIQHTSMSDSIYYLVVFESTKVFLVTGGNIKMGSLSASNPTSPFAHFRASCHCRFV